MQQITAIGAIQAVFIGITAMLFAGEVIYGAISAFFLGVFQLIVALVFLLRSSRYSQATRTLLKSYWLGVLFYLLIWVLFEVAFRGSGQPRSLRNIMEVIGFVIPAILALLLTYATNKASSERITMDLTDESIIDV